MQASCSKSDIKDQSMQYLQYLTSTWERCWRAQRPSKSGRNHSQWREKKVALRLKGGFQICLPIDPPLHVSSLDVTIFKKNRSLLTIVTKTTVNALLKLLLDVSYLLYSIFEGELAENIPVIHTAMAGCRIIGRMCVGEFPIVPNTTSCY